MNRMVAQKTVSSASLSVPIGAGTVANTMVQVTVPTSSPAGAGVRSKETEKAVFSYIQAIRTLGRTEVVVSDIANALSLPQAAVLQALNSLRNKGIKFV
jgi:hypothetical protein